MSQVEDTTLQIHTYISAQPVINYQGVDLTYWDKLTSAKLQNLHDTLHVSQQRMATFALVLSKHDARTDKAYAFTTAQIYLDSAGLQLEEVEAAATTPAQIVRPDTDNPMGTGDLTPAEVAADHPLETETEEDQAFDKELHIRKEDMIDGDVASTPSKPCISNDLRDKPETLYHALKEAVYLAKEDIEIGEENDTPPEE